MDDGTISDLLTDSERFLDDTQRTWLEPLGTASVALSRLLFNVNWMAMKALFRLQVEGLEHLPTEGPFIIAPNHASTLDPFALAASLPYAVLKRTYWAGRKGAVLRNPARRTVNRLARVVPISRNMRAIAVAACVLRRGHNLVWFPEGTRTTTGDLQPFKPGIGLLMDHLQVPAVPIFLQNTFENMPPGSRLPRQLQRISVCFGEPVYAGRSSDRAVDSPDRAESIADKVRRRVSEVCEYAEESYAHD